MVHSPSFSCPIQLKPCDEKKRVRGNDSSWSGATFERLHLGAISRLPCPGRYLLPLWVSVKLLILRPNRSLHENLILGFATEPGDSKVGGYSSSKPKLHASRTSNRDAGTTTSTDGIPQFRQSDQLNNSRSDNCQWPVQLYICCVSVPPAFDSVHLCHRVETPSQDLIRQIRAR